MLNSYKKYWTNYFNFSNRTSRKDYWLFILVNIIVNVVLSFVIVKTFGYTIDITKISTIEDLKLIVGTPVGLINIIWYGINIIPSFAISVRRMHDINKSGLAILVAIIPIIGWLIYLIFTLRASVNVNNNYGEQNN